jgi:hypothetical protein
MVASQTPSSSRTRIALSPLFFVASLSASLCFAAGILGLFAPDVFPPLAEKAVAYALIGVGVVLEAWSLSMLIGTIRQRQRG